MSLSIASARKCESVASPGSLTRLRQRWPRQTYVPIGSAANGREALLEKAPRGRNLKLEDRHASFTMPAATAKAKARPFTMYETVPALGVVLMARTVPHSQAKLR